MKKGDWDSIINQRVEAAVNPLQQKVETLEREKKETEAALHKTDFEQKIRKAATDRNVRPEAIEDVIGRAYRNSKTLDNGTIVLNDDQTEGAFIDALRATSGFLFGENTPVNVNGGGVASGNPNAVTISQTDAKDMSKWRAAKAKAKAEGKEGPIIV